MWDPGSQLVSSCYSVFVDLIDYLDLFLSSKHDPYHLLYVITWFDNIISIFESMSKSVNVLSDRVDNLSFVVS